MANTYGQRGGQGPNTGKRATTYEVELPDGTKARKRNYNVHADAAWAGIYHFEGRWFVGMVDEYRKPVACHYQNVVPAKKVA